MRDSDIGKKLEEEVHLGYFLDAYETVTGTALTMSSVGESPDFICSRASGELVGVELARSPHDSEQVSDDEALGNATMDSSDLLDAISGMITTKQLKRESPHWRTPDNTILVVELLNYCFDSVAWSKEAPQSDDYASAGFIEIWIADHSTLEAFGEVRLIGLYPQRFWGTHPQPALQGKPYG